jgi:hypothetical protein
MYPDSEYNRIVYVYTVQIVEKQKQSLGPIVMLEFHCEANEYCVKKCSYTKNTMKNLSCPNTGERFFLIVADEYPYK